MRGLDSVQTVGVVGAGTMGSGIAQVAAVEGYDVVLRDVADHLVASGICSIVLTSWGMIATDTNHAPACATTLIVSLGLLSTPPEVAVIAASIVVLVAFHQAVLSLVHRVVGTPPAARADG